MDVSIFIETTFDDGETKRRNIGRLRRAPDEFGSENLGLLLDACRKRLCKIRSVKHLMLAGNAMTVANNARSMMIEGVFSTLFSGEFG